MRDFHIFQRVATIQLAKTINYAFDCSHKLFCFTIKDTGSLPNQVQDKAQDDSILFNQSFPGIFFDCNKTIVHFFVIYNVNRSPVKINYIFLDCYKH